MRVLVLTMLLIGCGGSREDRVPEQVPVAYRAVAASAGHVAHVGNVACAACHGDGGFAPPPADLCERCHADQLTPLHPGTHAPRCQDCHAFGAGAAHHDAQDALIEALRAELRGGVVLLVKGSRSSAMERVVAALLDGERNGGGERHAA